MPLDAEVSVNWTVDKTVSFQTLREYGVGAIQNHVFWIHAFEAPRRRQSPRYTAEQIIVNRASVISEIAAELDNTMANFPVKLDSVQLDNVKLPDVYLKSIQTKQTQKNLAEAENIPWKTKAGWLSKPSIRRRLRPNPLNCVRQPKQIPYGWRDWRKPRPLEAKARALKNNP